MAKIDQKSAMGVVKGFLTVAAIPTVFHNQFDYLCRHRGIFLPKTGQKLKKIHSVLMHQLTRVFDI
jgi:hypothetical protein